MLEWYSNPDYNGTRANQVEEVKASECFTELVLSMQPINEWPKQVESVFTSHEENRAKSAFILQFEEKKLIVQWEEVSHFNRFFNTMACVQQILRKKSSNINGF